MSLHTIWQNKISFTPDQLLVGNGFYEVDYINGTFIRWTGPEPVSTLHFNFRRDVSHRINIAIHSTANDEILESLKIEIDSIPVDKTLSKGSSPAYVTAVIPEDHIKRANEPSEIKLIVSHTKPKEQHNAPFTNNKKYGIALSRIEIFPLTRALFIAEKYDDPAPFDGMHYIKHNPGVRDAIIHGKYKSAYEYFKNHFPSQKNGSYELHEWFDECPGDLYDILQYDAKNQYEKIIRQCEEEISALRKIVNRQGDVIRSFRKSNIKK